MKFIEPKESGWTAAGIVSDDTFLQLRAAFHARLREDRARLVVLGTRLSGSDPDPAQTFEEVRAFAHRLLGAAAIFGATDLREAAQTLEIAAHAAQKSQASHKDTQVWSALAHLADLLASMADSITDPLPMLGSRRRS
jgi:HPt (histidine-containing phosphotransfer) domain-containing protein